MTFEVHACCFLLFFSSLFFFFLGGGGSFEVARKGGRSGCTGVVVACAVWAGCLFLFLRLHRRETGVDACVFLRLQGKDAGKYIGVDVVFGVDACLFLRLQWRPEGT